MRRGISWGREIVALRVVWHLTVLYIYSISSTADEDELIEYHIPIIRLEISNMNIIFPYHTTPPPLTKTSTDYSSSTPTDADAHSASTPTQSPSESP